MIGLKSGGVEYLFELADIKPDVTLWAGSRRAQLNERVASVMQRFDDFCVERFDIDPDAVPTPDDMLSGRHPAAVLVHGDTSSAMAVSLSAFHLHVPVMHVEAGLRTGGNNLMPFWQGVVGVGLVAALVLTITGVAPFWGAGPTWQLAFFYLLAFGGTAMGCIAARAEQGPPGWQRGFLIAQVYTPYTWFLWPVLLRSTARQLTERGDWAKTEREPLGTSAPPSRA